MFISCHLPTKNDEIFLLYDKEDFNVEELGLNLEDVKIIEPNRIFEYEDLPILKLDDFLLKTIRPKERTVTHILAEQGIETIYHIVHNKILIDKKESNLSASQRKFVVERYNEIINQMRSD